ncbi:hypothetical protein DY000_02033089 [Brassica cretica]|uniref:Uncharacterized protein n=1 Tax=Brassica cretica TaxID=69181 RepID=A0ABQ7DIV4_BRACR|nr:hypothetical protein DY000_02033089 [Brassica cretica]
MSGLVLEVSFGSFKQSRQVCIVDRSIDVDVSSTVDMLAYVDRSFSSSCIDSILFCISCSSSGVDVVSIDATKCLSVDAGALLSIDLERFLVIDADIWC